MVSEFYFLMLQKDNEKLLFVLLYGLLKLSSTRHIHRLYDDSLTFQNSFAIQFLTV